MIASLKPDRVDAGSDIETDAAATVCRPVRAVDLALRELLEATIARWHAGETPDTHAVLGEIESLAASRTAQLELACEEFYLRCVRGESLSASVFCARFPDIWRSLEAQLNVDDGVKQVLGGESADFAAAESQNAALPVVPWPIVGRRFQGYVVDEELGRGGASRVYLCRAEHMGNRREVVKFSRRKDLFEGRTAGGLAHPHIMPILSAGRDPEGRLVLAMPYLARATLCRVMDLLTKAADGRPARRPTGSTVLEALRDENADVTLATEGPAGESKSSPSRVSRAFARGYAPGAISVMLGVAEALDFAHRRRVLHLDLKPSNVVVSADGHPWLLDFDMALDGRSGRGALGGTPPYMSPEQLDACCISNSQDARASLDERSDIFSFGVVLYELFTGRLPFIDCPSVAWNAASARVLAAAQFAGRRSDIPLDVDRPLVRLIDECLAHDPALRPRSAAELIRRLNELLSHWESHTRRRARRLWLGAAVALAASAGLSAAGAVVVVRENRRYVGPRSFADGIDRLKQGDLDTALADFDRALEAADETSGNPNVFRAKVLAARARVRERMAAGIASADSDLADEHLQIAIGDLIRAHRLAPSPQTLALRGYYHNLKQEREPAIVCYEQADRQWRSAAMLHNLGYSHSFTPDLTKASRRLSKSLALDADSEPALRHLAEVEARLAVDFPSTRDELAAIFAKAIAHIEQAVSVGPISGELLVAAATIYEGASRIQPAHRATAIDYALRASAYAPNRPIIERLFQNMDARDMQPSGQSDELPAAPIGGYDAVEFLDPLPTLLPTEYEAPSELSLAAPG